MNPDAPSSPMALLKGSLTKLFHEQSTAQFALATRQEERQAKFKKEVREALVRIQTKRTQDPKTRRGGLVFEDAVLSFVRAATQGAPCVFEATRATAGVDRSKNGDAVVRFTRERALAGAAVVFEAKREAGYFAGSDDHAEAAGHIFSLIAQRICTGSSPSDTCATSSACFRSGRARVTLSSR